MLIQLRFSPPCRAVMQTTDDFKFNPNKKSIREHPLLITNLFGFDRSGVESRSTLPLQFYSPAPLCALRLNRKSKSLASLVPLRRFPINSSDGKGLPGLLGWCKCRQTTDSGDNLWPRNRATPIRPVSRVFDFTKLRDRATTLLPREIPRKFRRELRTNLKLGLIENSTYQKMPDAAELLAKFALCRAIIVYSISSAC